MSVNTKLTAIADKIRELSGVTDKLGLDDMATNVGEANAEVNTQTELLTQAILALNGKAAGGGASVQSDWNQNNPSQPDYVKNRTHWVEAGAELPIQGMWGAEQNAFVFVAPLGLELGKAYVVTWDGLEYESTATEMSFDGITGIGIGNIAAATGGNTGEPFVIGEFDAETVASLGAYGMAASLDGSLHHEFSIKQETVYKLDNKFLDMEWIATTKTEEVTVVPATTIPLSDQMFSTEDNLIRAVDGDICRVIWNGSPYECTVKAMYFNDMVPITYMGNITLVTGYVDNGIPFLIAHTHDNNTSVIISAESAESVTIEIVKIGSSNPLPEKYVPKSVPMIQTATAGQTVVVKTVDPTGKPTEWETVDIDSTPISGSNNPVSSGGVYNALNNLSIIPDASTATEGAFLRVVNRKWAAVVLPNAEDGEF